jgi:hypothetical protein
MSCLLRMLAAQGGDACEEQALVLPAVRVGSTAVATVNSRSEHTNRMSTVHITEKVQTQCEGLVMRCGGAGLRRKQGDCLQRARIITEQESNRW